MDRQSPGEKQADTNRTVASTTPTTSAAITMATVSPSSSTTTTCTQVPSTSLSIISPDRQAVQVIQHAIHRPQSMAAQYLHQMYAAQQQHLMLQTAALQQHQHTPHLQSLATIQQASVCQRQSPSSSSSSLLHQPAGVSQNSITLPASQVTAQLIGRTQTSSSTGAATTISQQAMLLGNRPPNCNQAQMYLRTQMLILTPAATVAAVQSDLPAVTSCSSLPTSSQVQNLALRAHLPGALATAHSVILKPTTQSQALTPAASLSKTPVCSLKTNQLTDTSTETRPADVTRLASGPKIITPAYSPVQTHALVKQQLSCPPGQRMAHHQLIVQQATGGAPNHRQLQPIALRVAPQDTNSNPLPLSIKRLTSNQSQNNNDSRAPSSSSSSSSSSVTSVFASSAQTSIPAATVQPQPPPLVAAPQRRTSFPQVQNQRPPPPPPLVLPRLPQNPPASLQRLSLHSVQALAVQSGRVMLTEQELPVAEALVQMPYQNLPPPQTVAVDLKVHPVRRNETPSLGQTRKENGLIAEGRKEERSHSPQRDRTPKPLTGPPKQNGAAVMGSSSIISSRSVIRSPVVEEPSQLTTTSSNNSSNPPPPSPPLPPPIMPAAVRGPSQPPSSPASVPGSPERILTTHVLTHLVEGFVIREGLEPFPVVPSSLLADQQASLPECQEIQTNGDAAAEDSPLDADQSDSTDSEMENDCPAADVAELGESVAGVLQCEFCGSRGYAHTFLRSKRFCSMTCVRRFSVSCTKRITMLRAGRWGHRPAGRRGRPPSRVNGASREHFQRQARGSFGSEEAQEDQEEEEEDEPPVPMTTRLRKQAERVREREQERKQEREEEREEEEEEEGEEEEQTMTETITVSDGEEDDGCPSQWNVEQVFSYINSLPGGQDVAEAFRSQEIDGQALLLLTEDHLVSTMNLKLGPALKLCAHINSLKDA
ncbi:polyhomeotic-like protein 3 isoform X1 [Sparus aurata]|uniref:polyhomeotic-like protein 3 isoform X1 n=1 Tax=Sparus aurata TaxID=8175 RepID=UPI0011C1A3B5|nr:polyhomeotic-like protein 3 isoform X1 [Sparus aurata]XP_030257428.1 polyhomeotic-like protein 3 isoform X1 [Sparus aurata]